jgi:hypothetical protein
MRFVAQHNARDTFTCVLPRRFFYTEQLRRMEQANQAAVSFGDVMCQMQDMLTPEARSFALPLDGAVGCLRRVLCSRSEALDNPQLPAASRLLACFLVVQQAQAAGQHAVTWVANYCCLNGASGSCAISACAMCSNVLQVPECFTLRDLRRSRHLAGAMFNILFNLGKFVAYETRDPFVARQARRCLLCVLLLSCVRSTCVLVLFLVCAAPVSLHMYKICMCIVFQLTQFVGNL